MPKLPDSNDASDEQCREIQEVLDITQSSACSSGLSHQTRVNSSSSAIVSQRSPRSCLPTLIDITGTDNNRCSEMQADKSSTPSCTEAPSAKIECPTCFLLFPVNEIADHADSCADIWFGAIECDDYENVLGYLEVESLPELQSLSEEGQQETDEKKTLNVY